MTHAAARVEERLAQAGWTSDDREKLLWFAEKYASKTHSSSEGVRLAVLPELVGQKWGEESNGNEVWAVYRRRALVTVMLRRETQPDSGLRVDKVTRLV